MPYAEGYSTLQVALNLLNNRVLHNIWCSYTQNEGDIQHNQV